MTLGRARATAIDEALTGLARLDVADGAADAVRKRMHLHLERKTGRLVRQGALTRMPHGMAAHAALVAALLLLYLSGVVREALDLYGL
jgi:hypothetical protein